VDYGRRLTPLGPHLNIKYLIRYLNNDLIYHIIVLYHNYTHNYIPNYGSNKVTTQINLQHDYNAYNISKRAFTKNIYKIKTKWNLIKQFSFIIVINIHFAPVQI